MSKLPTYGITRQNNAKNPKESTAESFNRKGYAILNSGISEETIGKLDTEFEKVRDNYSKAYHGSRNVDFSIRALFSFSQQFLELAQNPDLVELLNVLFEGTYMLNQQNGIINRPSLEYSQARWHRDLPYQHFTSSKNIAINAIFCLDNFNLNNGGSFVLPYSHLFEEFPTDKFVEENEVSINAKKGDFIIFNAMTFHRGGTNQSINDRRGVNTVYSIPYIRHQIDLHSLDFKYQLSSDDKEFLGFNYTSARAISDIL